MSEATATAAEAGCPFCKMAMEYVASGVGIEQIGVSGVYHFEPLNPVAPGHRLFVPAFHYEDAAEAPSATGVVFKWAAWWAAKQGEDFNLIVNAGRNASQTVLHLHVHYVPRRPGDGLILPWSSLAQKRAEWEAERGEPEWEYRLIRKAADHPAGEAVHITTDVLPGDELTHRRRKAGPWEPVTNTESEKP